MLDEILSIVNAIAVVPVAVLAWVEIRKHRRERTDRREAVEASIAADVYGARELMGTWAELAHLDQSVDWYWDLNEVLHAVQERIERAVHQAPEASPAIAGIVRDIFVQVIRARQLLRMQKRRFAQQSTTDPAPLREARERVIEAYKLTEAPTSNAFRMLDERLAALQEERQQSALR